MDDKNEQRITQNPNFLSTITLNYKKVQFNENITIYVFEKFDDSHILTSTQRLADWARLSNTISAILDPAHRVQIRTRNFLLQDPTTTSSTLPIL